MIQKRSAKVENQVSAQELQHLIAVSSGFIDAYVIQCHAKAPMLLPQNIVISAIDSPTNVPVVEWHESKLPVYRINNPSSVLGVALVIEGEEVEQRFALMCDEMPRSIRVRISEVVDDERVADDKYTMQYVRIGHELFHVPNIEKIQTQIGIRV